MQNSRKTFLLEGQTIQAPRLEPGLYVTATPIGNLADITLRALRVLAAADAIYCEDTRVSAKLARNYGISTPLRAYHDHNAAKVRPTILRYLRDGAALALISDAGTPLISDPGFKLVREVVAEALPVTAIPGATALATGLALSGLPSDRVLFAGFPPAKKGARQTFYEEMAALRATLVFFMSTRHLDTGLLEMHAVFGSRQVAVARELTKMNEEVLRGSLVEVAEEISQRQTLKGEATVIVGPPADLQELSSAELSTLLQKALAEMSVRDAVDAVTEATGSPRRVVYKLALALLNPETEDGEQA